MTRLLVGLLFFLCAAGNALAQAYPTKIVRILVPTAPGNAADITTRLVTERLAKRFGQPVIVENRPGGAATGAIAAAATASAAPDGHTLLMTSTSLTINTAMFAQLPYNVERDFEAIALTGQVGMVLLTGPDSQVTSLRQFVDTVRKDPGKYNYAMNGRGSIQHLTMELMLAAIGAQMEPIPYKGSAPAMVDVISGRVPFMFDALSSATTYVTTGRVRALGVGSPKRFAALPNVPSFAESGIPELASFEVIGWVGLLAPKGTPKPIVDVLNQNVMEIVQEKEIKDKLGAQGLDIPAPHPPEKFRDFLRDQIAKWDAAARAAKIPRE